MNLFSTFGRTPWAGDRPDLYRTAQHRETRTYIHASSRIRTKNPSVWAVQDHTNNIIKRL